ncbi:Rv2175c family DNA-binding protein [Georgenia sp. SYP-B2076]|uniref:Rv2175c family DNA-binding protein n=1 Tax=Georgenia sp. SYP-B2076 TaxID=2495881 RepID=UPI001F0C41B2|nr:Rv2175c family DNA-binding protein [Georgenia sp. SYP-B2076]
MSSAYEEPSGWYSVPEVAEMFGLRQREVRSLLREKRLLAVPHGPNGAASVAAELVVGPGEPDGPGPLPALRGTLILLGDARYDDHEAFKWLFTVDDELGSTPIRALREGRTHAVRRIAQTLAF